MSNTPVVVSFLSACFPEELLLSLLSAGLPLQQYVLHVDFRLLRKNMLCDSSPLMGEGVET